MHFKTTTALKTRHQNKSTNINNYTQDDMRVTVSTNKPACPTTYELITKNVMMSH